MSYLPRPTTERTAQDVDEIYALTADELKRAATPEDRRAAFRRGMLRAYEAGVDAQREVIHDYEHDRPTPVPPAPAEDDPGTLPPGPPPAASPGGVWRGGEKKKKP